MNVYQLYLVVMWLEVSRCSLGNVLISLTINSGNENGQEKKKKKKEINLYGPLPKETPILRNDHSFPLEKIRMLSGTT